MKKIHVLLTTLAVVALSVGCAGCKIDPNDETQVKAIAQQAGMWASVGWIALDNPTTEQIAVVRGLMDQVEEASAGVVMGKTYTEVVYPALVTYIDENVESQYKPLAKTGILSALNGLDLLFVTHPEWRENEQLAHSVVQAFILGARNGLSLKESDPIMVQVRANAAIRVRVLSNGR